MTLHDASKRFLCLVLPAAIAFLFAGIMYLALDFPTFALAGALMLIYFITPIGKYILIPGALLVGVPGVIDGLRPLHGQSSPFLDIFIVVSSVVMIDSMCSMFLVLNLDVIHKIPGIGPWIGRIEEQGRERLRKKGREGIAFAGLTGFVALSVQGSGGIGSTLLGRVGGMKGALVFAAVTIGATIGCTAIAVASWYVGGPLVDAAESSTLQIASIITLAVIFSIVLYVLSRRRGNGR
ncbi:MAG: small multi-drug export protein [Euryarchaeota archaeon]|nr:small multi-drug export protein [Euryarchaeota archaeon]